MDAAIKFLRENKLILLLFLTGAVFLFLKYLTPLTAPILLAVLFVTIFGPMTKRVQEKIHLHRQVGMIILMVLALFVVGVLVWILGVWLIGSLPQWVKGFSDLEGQFENAVHQISVTAEKIIGVNGDYLEERILKYAGNMFSDGEGLIKGPTVPVMLSQSLNYLGELGSAGLFLITFFISTVLLAKDYDLIMNSLLEHREFHVLLELIVGVIRYIATFLKAQLMIMGVISVISAVTLTLAGIRNGILFGILAGLLDALPFIGTGSVLMPLAFFQILQGKIGRAVICVILYIGCILVRQFMEPKLIGGRIGVPPIAVLISLYIGIRLFGAIGIIKGPLGFVMIKEGFSSILKTSQFKEGNSLL